jgi:hypothetical protein
MRPSWKAAPKWARWLAMDKDGSWWWYEERPAKDASAGKFHNDVEGSLGQKARSSEELAWEASLEWYKDNLPEGEGK